MKKSFQSKERSGAVKSRTGAADSFIEKRQSFKERIHFNIASESHADEF